jgi:TetR/AcrR family transcriptional repressor of nem operon
MRRSRTEKDMSRRLILDAAARLFRERGIDGVSVAEVMQAADMTHGGFYRHFAGKDDLLAQAVASALTGGADGQASEIPQDLAVFAAAFLSPQHRDGVGGGCVFAALGTELVRGPAEARRAMTAAIQRKVDLFARSAPGKSDEERRRSATGSWAAMIGAMLLARISDDLALSEQILDDTRAWMTAQWGDRQAAGDGEAGAAPGPDFH